MRGRDRGWSCESRRGGASPVVILLLSGILVALLALIAITLTQKEEGREGADASPKPGAHNASAPAPRPEPIGDPGRIREMLQVGKTYRIVVKAKLKARVEDKAWGAKKVVSLAYAAEMAVDRTIESNDGRKVIERRHFTAARNVKLLCDLEDFSIELGPPGVLALGALEYIQPGSGAAVAVAKPLVEAVLGREAGRVADREATKAVASVNGLSGKTVRITYVDGLGVESVEPVDCTLTTDEDDFLKRVAVLSDGYILPDRRSKPGDTWPVDGAQLAGFLDPTLQGIPEGEVVVRRDEDYREADKQYTGLQIEGGTVEVNASDASTRRIGTFTPRGTLKYSITDGFVEEARLNGRINFERVSRDHILFETSFRTRPTLEVSYSCSVR